MAGRAVPADTFRGLALALEGALNLHGDYPNNKKELAGKKGPKPKYPSPDKLPGLRDKYGATLNYAGNVVESCIHCHQIGDAERMAFIERGESIPDQLLFSHPHPKAIGLILDPDERASVLRVDQGSPASDAGFQPGDRILTLSGQPLLSIADVQWVLHHTAAEGAKIPATVQRGDKVVPLTLELTARWRDRDDIAWRVSTWEMRRFTIGGMVLNSLPPEERTKLDLADGSMALVIEHIGQYNPHDAAKRSGFRQGDIVIAYDGKTDLLRETDVLAYALRHFPAGRDVDMELIRNGKRETRTLNLP